MAVLFIDGFDHYASADILQKWTAQSGSPTINSTGGRASTGACELNAAGEYIQKSLVSNLATAIVGARVKVGTLSTSTDFLYLMDGASLQVKIRIRTDGKLEAFRNATSLGVSATAPITANTFIYIEAKVTIHGSTGAVTVYVNGSAVLTLTSQNTQNTANAYVTAVRFQSDGETLTLDDVYLADMTGSAPQNDALGDCRVDTRYPASDGTYEAMTPSSGVNSYDMVNDTAPNGDTDYVASSSVGAKDSFGMGTLSDIGGATIFCLQQVVSAKKDNVGTRQLRQFVRNASTDTPGSSQVLTTSYAMYLERWATNPVTGNAWAEAEVNAAEGGVEVAS